MNELRDRYDGLGYGWKILILTSFGFSILHLLRSAQAKDPFITTVDQLVALPFDALMALIGDLLGYVFPAIEDVTDPLFPDLSGDDYHEGPGGELRSMLEAA